MKIKALLAVLLSAVMVLATSAFADEKVQWVDVPPQVQKTITSHSSGGKVTEVEKDAELINGKPVTIYEAEVTKPDGKKIEIKVAEDGKLIKVEDD